MLTPIDRSDPTISTIRQAGDPSQQDRDMVIEVDPPGRAREPEPPEASPAEAGANGAFRGAQELEREDIGRQQRIPNGNTGSTQKSSSSIRQGLTYVKQWFVAIESQFQDDRNSHLITDT
ncbi:MAG: hypothetical protein M1830_005437, partial [Pleopsidium flavum]